MLQINFNPFPVLTTDHLVLRRISPNDMDEMFKYRSDKHLMRFIPHRYATSKDQVTEMIDYINKKIDAEESINWAITLKGDDAIIGTIGYVQMYKDHHRAEIGYMLHTPHHGTGIMQQAFKCIVNYGFDIMKLHSIEAVVNHENIASKRLLERNGFTNDACFKDYLYHDGKYMDANVYSLINVR